MTTDPELDNINWEKFIEINGEELSGFVDKETSIPEGESEKMEDEASSVREGEREQKNKPEATPSNWTSARVGERAKLKNRHNFGDDFVNKFSDAATSNLPIYRTYESALFQLKRKHTGKHVHQSFIQSLDWGDSFEDLAVLAQTSYAQDLF